MNIGVIGTGKMGENHVRTYKSLSDHCYLVGVYDVDEEKRNQIASKYNVIAFQSITDLLKKVDAVSITVPTDLHYEVGLTCIEYNVHMLMEKPIAATISQARTLVQKASDKNIKLQVGHIELFNPLIQTLKKEIENQKVIAVDIHRMAPFNSTSINIDVVHDLMIHDLYILDELLNDEISDFYSLGNLLKKSPNHAIVIAKFTQGVVAQLTASFQSNKNIRSIHVLTDNAYIIANILRNEINITRDTTEKADRFPKSVTETTHLPPFVQPPLTNQLTEFITCIKNDKNPSVTGEDGIKVLTISSKISDTIKNHS